MLFHGQGEQELTSSKPQVCNRHFTRHNMSQPYNLRLHSAPPGSPGTCVCASCCRTGGGSAQITLVTVTVFDCLPHDCGVQFQCTSLQSSLTHLLHNLPFLQWILDLGAIHTLPILRAVFVQDVQAKRIKTVSSGGQVICQLDQLYPVQDLEKSGKKAFWS